MSWFDDIIDIGEGAATVANMFGLFGGDDLPGPVKKAMKDQRSIVQALIDPQNSQMFQNLRGEFAEDINADISMALQDFVRAENLAAARGLPQGLVSPERRDEAIAMATMQSREQAEENARAQARQFLQAAAGLNTSLFSGAPEALIAQGQAQPAQAQFGINSLANIFKTLPGLLDGNPAQTGQPMNILPYSKPPGSPYAELY